MEFVSGVILGVLLVVVPWLVFNTATGKKKLEPVKQEDDYAARIALQWQNMAVYDGTEKGQQEVR